MVRARSLPVVLTLLVVLAGCNGLAPATSPTVSDEQTASPAVSPTETTPGQEFPPGLTTEGVSEPFALSDAHAAALDTSYTVREAATIRYANGTVHTNETSNVAVASNDSRYRYTSTVRGTASNFVGGGEGTLTAYSNGTVVLQRVEHADNTTYGIYTTSSGDPVRPSEVYHGTPRNAERIVTLFGEAENVSVAERTGGAYDLRATLLAVDALDVRGTTIRNVTDVELTATVTADGLVRSYELSLRGTVDGNAVTVTERTRYSGVGSTTVARPGWYDEATANGTG